MKRTSRLYNDLLELLKQSDWVDQRHLQTLVWMVLGLICAGCVNLTQWTAYTQSRAKIAQSHQRRFSRWLHNSRINVHRLYSPIIKQSLKGWGESTLVLLLDTSMLWNQYCLVRLAVQYRGRAIPVTWRVGEALLLEGVQITKTNLYGGVHLALAHDPISGERWYIVSDEPTTLQTFREYGQRFNIRLLAFIQGTGNREQGTKRRIEALSLKNKEFLTFAGGLLKKNFLMKNPMVFN